MARGTPTFPISLSALLALGCGLAATGVFSVWLANAEHKEDALMVERIADIRFNALRNGLGNGLDALATINQLFATTGTVSQAQFRTFTEPLLERHPYVHGFAYQRFISQTERRRYEADMRKTFPGFFMAELEDGKLVPARTKPQYRVIQYVEPLKDNRLVVGLDASSMTYQDRAIEAASTTGQAAATGLFRLVQEPGSQLGFAMVMPVYRNDTPLTDGATMPDAITGYTVAVFRAGDLVEKTLRRAGTLDRNDVHISVFAGEDPQDRTQVFTTQKANRLPIPASPWRKWLSLNNEMVTTRSFELAGMHWRMEFSASPRQLRGPALGSWSVLALGTLISLLFAGYLQSLARRANDLAEVNAVLNADIVAREKIERALRESEDRFRRLADLSSDWYWEQDDQFRFTRVTRDLSFDGIPVAEFLGRTRWDILQHSGEVDWAAHKAVLNSHQPFTDLEYRIVDRKGRSHWVAVNGEPVFDLGGTFLGYRGTAKDITDRKEVELALRQSQTELRELAAHQQRVKEDERRRIAREIHDDLGQHLLALRIDVSMLEADPAVTDPAFKQRIGDLLAQIDTVMKSVRMIINDLRPPVLDLGLQAAIEWQVRQFRQRSGVACSLTIENEGFDAGLDEECATSIFRIVQESLTNVSRHAYAKQVNIVLRQQDDRLQITIADDGVGTFPGNMRKPRSFGLIGIRERIHSLGGEFNIDSLPGNGTILTLSIPNKARITEVA